MERQGAEVVGYDLSENEGWDVVPFARADLAGWEAKRRDGLRRLNNSWWLAHRAFGSKARVVYGSVYAIPSEIGPVDVSTFGSVLLHVRDPFLALQNAASLTRETIVVSELVQTEAEGPAMQFVPSVQSGETMDTWWWMTPDLIIAMLGVLGFEECEVSYSALASRWGEYRLCAVVGRRTDAP
jgi:hypothetical protein